jgi:hypothetical protein
MIADQAATLEILARMQANGFELSTPLCWGFYFADGDRVPLERVSAELTEYGYLMVELRQMETGTGWLLHMSKTEILPPDKLHRRNIAFNELAEYCGAASYDGWDAAQPQVGDRE